MTEPDNSATIEKARALRAEHAHAAAYQADRARTAAHDAEAARWREEYRRSVARCRRLGELIRARGADQDPTTGEAA